jgi:hypothetical protein
MKRPHVPVSVEDTAQSIWFCSAPIARAPTVAAVESACSRSP